MRIQYETLAQEALDRGVVFQLQMVDSEGRNRPGALKELKANDFYLATKAKELLDIDRSIQSIFGCDTVVIKTEIVGDIKFWQRY